LSMSGATQMPLYLGLSILQQDDVKSSEHWMPRGGGGER
jgi:hypothetical protein